MGHKQGPADQALVDRAWRGYDPRAGFPTVVAAAIVSIVLQAGRWYLDDFSVLADRAGALAFYGMTLLVWPGLLALLVYRMVTYTYRVTDRAVLVDRGSLSRPELPVWFAELADVGVEVGWLGQRLGFGSVVLREAGGRAVTLAGVRDPAAFAAAIRDAAAKVKPAA